MSSHRHRLAIVIGSVLFALVVSEIALRVGGRWIFVDNFLIGDNELGWSLRPNLGGWSSEENIVWIETNSAGFRDRERALTPPPHTRRVAVIGDSFIHGFFLPLEQTYPAVLERDLAACAATGVEVLSFGALGYNTTQELLTYRLHAARYSPAIVIVAIFTWNDIYDNHPKLSTEPAPRYVFGANGLELDQSFRALLPPPPRWPWRRRAFEFLTTRWRTGQLLNMAAERAMERTPDEPDADPEVWVEPISIYRPPTVPEHKEAWQLTEAVLLKFAQEVAANGAEFWIATLFNTEQVEPHVDRRRALERELGVENLFYPDHRIAEFGRAHGIPVINLAEPVGEYTAATGEYVNGGGRPTMPPGTGHWNATGTRVSADISAKQICAASKALQ